jgi:hypothetical protein
LSARSKSSSALVILLIFSSFHGEIFDKRIWLTA